MKIIMSNCKQLLIILIKIREIKRKINNLIFKSMRSTKCTRYLINIILTRRKVMWAFNRHKVNIQALLKENSVVNVLIV